MDRILSFLLLIECDMIPNNRNEIPTCDVAANYQHLASIAQFIPPLDAEAKILLLIGRDLMQAHHVLDQRLAKPYQPYAQRLKLGWIIVGESCLDGAHIPKDASVLKTFIDVHGKSSVLEPCSSKFHVSDCDQDKHLFKTTKDDDKPKDFGSKDLAKKQWKGIQHLANQFWHRWKSEFLPSLPCLQSRKKWQQDRKNVQEGDIVLMCDKSLHRNEWPVGIIIKTHTSDDNRVRKVDIRLGKDRKTFTRPVNELIVLLPN
ncbi:unnamed protein product [Mytilus edulis]|uniref:DUF5641 domain-containing protein n=1 Tax=Mytilus edulis TaxID=6550 RepID=A0A8S3VLX6_MYTED|nr:unnamed protein product [Mytilus edulis]